jgi:Rrf2 family protein
MLTQTSELAVNALVFLGLERSTTPVSPRYIAEHINASPTYLAKVTRLLVKASILRAYKGVQGGVKLAMEPKQITLMAIIEACQGKILPDYCQENLDPRKVCAYHAAMYQLHLSMTGLLSQFTLEQMIARPWPASKESNVHLCHMAGRWPNLESYLKRAK